MSKRKFYLVNNWEAGYRHGTTFTANGLETETYDKQYTISGSNLPLAMTSSNNLVTLTEQGYKIAIKNTAASTQTTTIKGFYDNLDVKQLYRVVVNITDSIIESPENVDSVKEALDAVSGTTPSSKLPFNLRYEAYGLQGLFDFTGSNAITLTMPAGATWYLYATDGGYMAIDRFMKQRRPVAELESDPALRQSYYITELFKYNKLEDIQQFFLPLVDAIDLKAPDTSVDLTAYVASSDVETYDFSTPATQWFPIDQAPSIVTRSKPYFRFKLMMPVDKIVAATKVGYAIFTNYGYAEPSSLFLTASDVEQTVYRPNFQVKIGSEDFTQYVDSISAGSVVIQMRKIDENRNPIFMKDVTIMLDGVVVDSGRVTGISKQEAPNSIAYTITYTNYRALLGTTYQDNAFAFNAAPKDLTTVPFANEFEFINYIVNYSPAANGVILNSEKHNSLRSLSFWSDAYDTVNRIGGMGFSDSPDKWVQFYTNSQKISLETIEQVANANRLTAEVTHTGNVILSDLIPHDDCTLEFNSSYHKDETSLLSKCTHRYHDYVSITDGRETHTYVPDHRLYVPDVSYDAMQAASVVRVNGTTGKNQIALSATEQYIGTIKGFDKGTAEYVAAGSEINYRTELTTREPSDKFRLAFFTKNSDTQANEQTLLKGTPKVEGWENVTYESDQGGLFQPSIQSAPAGLKIEQKWVSGSLTYEDGDFNDMYGVKFLEVKISTDDLRDEPVRQGLLGAFIGFIVAIAAVAVIAATGGAGITLLAPLAGGISLGFGGMIAGGTALGFALGVGNGSFVSKINVLLPLKIKGIPAISAHQEYQETPLIGLPENKWFPKWAKGAYQEVLEAKDNLGIEPKVVDNPFIVSLTNYKQPNMSDYSDINKYKSAIRYNSYNKELHNIVASGLTLREWLKARNVTLRYAGNPNWFPYQFIAIAKPPVYGTTITEYEYFYTLGPQSTTISVGGEVTTEISAAYVGSSSGNTDIRYMEVLNNSLTLN